MDSKVKKTLSETDISAPSNNLFEVQRKKGHRKQEILY